MTSAEHASPQQTFKLLLIGESRVGKSSIINRYASDKFSDSTMSTVGVDFRNKEVVVDGKAVKLQIWDSAGQERFRTIVASYYRGAHGVMIVYDVTFRESFEKVVGWLSQLDEHAGDSTGSGCSKILVGNKSDLTAKRVVSVEEGEALAASLGMSFLETSAKTGANVDEAFAALARLVRARPAVHRPIVKITDTSSTSTGGRHSKKDDETCC